MGSKPVVIKTDSSTGIAQIFAKTAINALKNARARGFISLSEPYDFNDYEDAWYVWDRMHSNDDYSIDCCSLVILDCQYEFSSEIPYSEFFDYSAGKIKRILARYNGTNDKATEYGEACYKYYEILKAVNE